MKQKDNTDILYFIIGMLLILQGVLMLGSAVFVIVMLFLHNDITEIFN